MSRRKQGKPKGGRAARHHEPRGVALPPEPRRHSFSHDGRDLTADGRVAVDDYFRRKHDAKGGE